MPVITSDTQLLNTQETAKNKAAFELILQQFKEIDAAQKMSGGPKAQTKQSDLGKFPVRKRIKLLLDTESPWLELSACAGYQLYTHPLPAAGIVCGIGYIENRPVMIIANDPTVKAGTYFSITVKKHLRAQKIAKKLKLPCVYLVDSGGIFLPEQAEVFPDQQHFGKIFYHQAKLSEQGIAQIAVVLGSCTAGGAYVPAMADENIMVHHTATIFLAGPPLVKAATGESVDAETLGGAEMHCKISGVADHLAKDEADALSMCRSMIAQLPMNTVPPERQATNPIQLPRYPAEELYGLISADLRMPMEIKQIIARIIDDSDFEEFKPLYGTTLITGFAKLGGYQVGIIANNGILVSEAAQKGTHFIELACQRQIPLIFLQNITGFMVGQAAESGGIAKHGAKMVTAVSCAAVPKFTVIIGGSYGAGNYAMCGRAYEPNFLWLWPNARCAVMGGEQAALVLSSINPNYTEKQHQNLVEAYDEQSRALYSTARLWDDGIIDPKDTRDVLIQALKASQFQPVKKTGFGIFRM